MGPFTCHFIRGSFGPGFRRRSPELPPGRRASILAISLLLFLFASSVQAGWLVESVLARAGDDPRWAARTLDETHWTPLDPLQVGRALPFLSTNRLGWYRIRFRAHPQAGELLAISAGFVGTVSELYLNGERIGGGGSFEPLTLPQQRAVHCGFVSAERLRGGRDATHVLAIRVRSILGRGGLLGGPVGVEPLADFLPLRRNAELSREVIRLGAVSLCLGWAVVLFLLRILDRAATEFHGALLPTLLLAVTQAAYSQIAEIVPLPPGLKLLLWIVVQLSLPVAFYLFFRRIRPRQAPLWDRLVGWSLAGVMIVGFLGEGRPVFAAMSYAVYFVVVWAASGEACYRAGREGNNRGWIYFAAWLPILLAAIADFSMLWTSWLPHAAMSFAPSDLGVLLYVLVFGILVMHRYGSARVAEARLRLQVLQAQSDERRRIGRDLHDGVAQELQGLQFTAEIARRTGPDPALRETMGSMAEQLGGALCEVRRLASDLATPVVGQEGLVAALRSLSAELSTRHGIRIETVLGDVPSLPAIIAENLFRLAQEALRNACRHSGAPSVTLRLRADRHLVHLEIEDSGRGFDASRLPPGRLGVRGLAERAAVVNGKLDLHTATGQGTLVRLRVPIPASPT